MRTTEKQAPVDRTARYIIGVVVFSIFLVLFQLFRWQVLDYARFSTLANDQLSYTQDIFTKRGTIYTQDGVVLAVDSPGWVIILSLTNSVDQQTFLQQKDAIFTQIATIIEQPVDILNASFDPNHLSYQILYRGIDKRQNDMLAEKQFIGIYTQESVKRLYPNGSLFSHVIGYVSTDNFGNPVGNYGVEGFFWGDIKGKEGASQQAKDLSGKAIISTTYKNIKFREGKNIVLTVNSGIEKKVEKILAQGVKDQRGDSGTAIIIDPKTGEIIAMASYPAYDPNEYWKIGNVSVFKNTAVTEPYEYGSVQKPLTIAMGINDGKLTTTDICSDTGKLKVQDKYVYNFGFAAYGKVTPEQTLLHSDNICAATYGLRIGAQAMYNYLVKLGIGAPEDIGIDEEETSYLKPADKWLKIDTATISFGQTVSATPLQFISAMSTIANHGERMQPMLVQKIYNDEESIAISPTSDGQIFSRQTADTVAQLMRQSTMERNDMASYRGVYAIAGKTGTAQVAKPDGSGYYNDRVNVTYVGFAPADDARFIMLVKIANPRNGNLANLTVLPVWLKIFNAVKDDLGVPKIK